MGSLLPQLLHLQNLRLLEGVGVAIWHDPFSKKSTDSLDKYLVELSDIHGKADMFKYAAEKDIAWHNMILFYLVAGALD